MPNDERREKAIREIRAARGAIIAIAAKWQAAGRVDTSPLVEPLTKIQQALTVLELPTSRRRRKSSRAGPTPRGKSRDTRPDNDGRPTAGDAPIDQEQRRLYGELRRHFSGLRVSAAAMDGERDPERLLGWLTMVEDCADRCLSLLDLVDLIEEFPITPVPPE